MHRGLKVPIEGVFSRFREDSLWVWDESILHSHRPHIDLLFAGNAAKLKTGGRVCQCLSMGVCVCVCVCDVVGNKEEEQDIYHLQNH